MQPKTGEWVYFEFLQRWGVFTEQVIPCKNNPPHTIYEVVFHNGTRAYPAQNMLTFRGGFWVRLH